MASEFPVALITGAGKRIGAALATHLHARGFAVALHCHQSRQDADALAAGFNAARRNSALVLCADLADSRARDTLVPDALAEFGRLDVLINNASTFFPTPVGTATDADWDALFDANARAPWFLAQAAAPYLAKKQGCIVNMLDIYAERPKPKHTVYGMAKAAQRQMTKALALELAPSVRVNGIAPGAILWPEAGMDAQQQQALLTATPLARMGTVDDICAAAEFLIERGLFCTGQILDVDGGRLLR